MILEENYTLSNEVSIPKLGLGTWFIKDENAAQAVRDSVKLGYRHIDTAQAYGNEAGVGEGVRTCGIQRSEIFVTTKLDAGIKSYKEAVASIEGSIKKIGLDYMDLMIIHSPQPWNKSGNDDRYQEGNREAWRALEEAYSPVGHGMLLENETLVKLAKQYKVSVPQLCIRYTLQLGLLPRCLFI